jgi:WD40 repeat protein/transcriptional regulator with XRE-family HTH domain
MPAQDADQSQGRVDPGLELIRRPDPLAVTTPAEFAHAFATLREQAGISIRDLARGAGATSSTVGNWFSGRQLPPVSATSTVEKLLAGCGVPDGQPRQAWVDALNRVRRLPGPRPTDTPVPYRGLESYGADDSAFFFGREKLVARLVALVTSAAGTGPTILVGPSGSGKSSALQAGLAARLSAVGWQVVTVTPGPRPLEVLDAALADVRGQNLPPGSRVAVVVDQFEELFTLCGSEADRHAFVTRLTGPLSPGPAGPVVTVVIALRADFYAAALAHEPLSAALQDRQVVVGPMTGTDLRRAIIEPARAAGVQLDPGLVELVLHDMAPASPVAPDGAAARPGTDTRPAHDASTLPLMSFALLETWRRRRSGRLTVEDYVAAGGISGAVRAAAERVYGELTTAQRDLVRQLFLRLVTVSDASADTRRRATAAELGLDVPEGDAMSEVLEQLVAARLLATTETTVEIAHEALLTAWPRLRAWLDADRAGLVTRRRLADAALTWERDGRDPGALHRGTALISAREWATDRAHLAELIPVERAFLDASLSAHEREQAAWRRRGRRMQSLLAAVSTLALLTTTLSAVALVQRSSVARDRDRALSRQLAETASRLRRTDPSAAAQFAVLAWRTAQTAEARSALLDTSATPIARRVGGPGGPAAVAVSGDAHVMAAAGEQGGLRVWTLGDQPDPVTTEVSTLSKADDKALYAIALNREGTVVAAAGASGVLHAWDLRAPSSPVPLPSAPLSKGPILGLAFSADGRTLAVAIGDGRVILYDVRPGKGAATLTALGAPLQGPAKGLAVQAVAFSSDGRALAAAGVGGKVQLWTLTDRAHPEPVPVQLTGATGTITSLAFSPDGDRLVAGSKDQKAYGWVLATPSAAPQRYQDAGSWVNAVTVSPDNAYVGVGGSDHHLRLYEVATRALVADLPHPEPVTAATYLPDGRTLVTSAADGMIRLWPVPGPTTSMPSGRTFGLAYLGHDRLAAMTSRNSLRLFDVSQPHRPRPVGTVTSAPDRRPGTGFSGTMAVNRPGTLLAAGGTDGAVWLYHVGTDTPSVTLAATLPPAQKGLIEAVALSPDGKTLATGSDNGALQLTDVSDPSTPRPLGAPIAGPGVTSALAFSPDGAVLAAGPGNPNAVTLFDVRDRARPQRIGPPLSGPRLQVYSVAFSPDGSTLAVGSADRTVRLLDTSDPERARWLAEPLLGAGDDVNGVAYSPDGRTVASASGDGGLRLWDVSDREEPVALASLTAPGGQSLFAVAFDRAAGRVAAAGVAQTVWQWELDPAATADRVCALAGAPMSLQEWTRYLPSVPYSVPCQG